MPPLFAAQPLFAPLAPWLASLPGDGAMLEVERLNALAAERGIVTGGGAPLRFVVPGASGLSREERAYWLGEVETRPGNWRDGFNALAWLAYPLTKAALNARHHHALAAAPVGATCSGRGGRAALSQFDACGVAVVSPQLELWQGIRARRWQEVFATRRAETQRSLRLFVLGHASFDMLRTPHLGLCGKALFLHVEADWLAWPAPRQLADVDRRMALRFSGDMPAHVRPRDFQTLPLLGIPGTTPDNEHPAYYDERRRLRSLRPVDTAPDSPQRGSLRLAAGD